MEHCTNCEDMPERYVCTVCGKTGAEVAAQRGMVSDFKYQWYAVIVRLTVTEPVVTYRHGPRKGEAKSTPWTKTLLDLPTQYMYYGVQGIRNEKHCETIVRESYKLMIAELESAGYTDVSLSISAVGTTFG